MLSLSSNGSFASQNPIKTLVWPSMKELGCGTALHACDFLTGSCLQVCVPETELSAITLTGLGSVVTTGFNVETMNLQGLRCRLDSWQRL